MSDDRAAARAAHAALCAAHGVRDLYEGDCRGCGECCSRFVPVSVFDEGYEAAREEAGL